MSNRRIDWEARFFESLNRIANMYDSSRRVISRAGRHGLEPAEALEYSYDNIQGEARAALKGYRASKTRSNRKAARTPEVQAETTDRDREDSGPGQASS